MKKFNLFFILIVLFLGSMLTAMAEEPTAIEARSVRHYRNALYNFTGIGGGEDGYLANVNEKGSLQVLGQTMTSFEVYSGQADCFVTDADGNKVTGDIYGVLVNGVSVADYMAVWNISSAGDATGANARPIDVQVGIVTDTKVATFGGLGIPYTNGMYITRTDTAVTCTVLYKAD